MAKAPPEPPHVRLARLRAVTTRIHRYRSAWLSAIREAVADGAGVEEVARAADITVERVDQIVRSEPPDKAFMYRHNHYLVRKTRGAAVECSRCGASGAGNLYEWANLSGDYEDVDDYAPMCVTCHRRYDRDRRRALRLREYR